MRTPTPTPVFDSYWRFAATRQRVYRARLTGQPAEPLDPVLREYRFTNAYRASDRVSQRLIRDVVYDGQDRDWPDTFLRVMLFKIFNREATWDLIKSEVGQLSVSTFDPEPLADLLDVAMGNGLKVYSAAYIMPSPSLYGAKRKHRNHLRLLAQMLSSGLPSALARADSMEAAFRLLLDQPSIGPFLAYQLVTDLNYTPHLDFSEREFVQAGPGALDGIAKCFSDLGEFSPEDAIRWVVDTQQQQFAHREISFDDLWGRPLQLIDAQNIFCEVDKYARVAHPEVAGRRTRIKQRYEPARRPLTAYFPPKWGINERVRRWLATQVGFVASADQPQGLGAAQAALW